MRIIKLSLWLPMLAAVTAGGILFWTSGSVQDAESELRSVKKAVVSEHKSIHVLRAEWAYLNSPDRLEDLAQKYLGYDLLSSTQVAADASDLPEFWVPAVPHRKPSVFTRPVSYASSLSGTSSGRLSQKTTSIKKVKPVERPAASRSFQSLLQDLDQGVDE